MTRMYSPAAAKSVEAAIRRMQQGELKSDKNGKAGTVINPKQVYRYRLVESTQGQQESAKTTGVRRQKGNKNKAEPAPKKREAG